ncbi:MULTISPECIES: hypothetical protein [Cyanophyceae]|uniref:hypothetical protein n=1 Tax=Cyanophyceae TaxID=3028117 RepID=UPI0016837669|nr:hypothetical protein [Trichocoleus sp. FACHB-832]MBD1905449.1 hypothetical protein [Trichocoleus sp. FACHB-832]
MVLLSRASYPLFAPDEQSQIARSHIMAITNRRYTIKTRRDQVKKVRDRILRLYSNSRVGCDTYVGTWQCHIPTKTGRTSEPRYIPRH